MNDSIFTADVVMPAQFFDLYRSATGNPYHNLMIAVLRDAIHVYQRGVSVGGSDGHRITNAIFREAQYWLFLDEDKDFVFSFASVCDHLDIDPDQLRKRLKETTKIRFKRSVAHPNMITLNERTRSPY